MRLWHTKLIKALPNMHLQSQWRELSAIAGAIQKNGTPNHVLVNFVLDYDYDNFISYAYYIRQEMTNRGIRTMNSVWEKIISLKPDYTILPIEEVYKDKMDFTYLTICYYNLLEKYICGMFDSKDWNNIQLVLTNFNNVIS
jgi:uncharacterized protein (TIGR02328 family)